MFVNVQVGSLTEPLTGRRWAPPEFHLRLNARTAAFCKSGFEAEDRVFLLNGNTLEFFVDLLAIWSLGGTACPIDARLTPFEIGTLAQFATPRFALLDASPDPKIVAALREARVSVLEPAAANPPPPAARTLLPPVTLDQEALILFTSGTTGQPKGVVHTHRSLRARWTGLRESLGTASFERTLCLLPTHFGHGLICNALFPWLSGNDLYVLPAFQPDLVMGLGKLIDEHQITFMSSVPPVWRLALRIAKPPTRRSLRRVFIGSAPLSAAMWRDVQDWTGTKEVMNAYGITETGSWLAGTTVPGFSPEDGLIGEAWGGVLTVQAEGDPTDAFAAGRTNRPGELGLVWVNTPGLMKEYLGREDLTRDAVKHGWFLTGDIGYQDERGWLYLKGREREEINKGGMKVYPADIDAVAERFDATQDVCTFSCEDPLFGENVAIALVLKSSDTGTLSRLVGWCEDHLAKHQMPVRWYVVDEIPRTSRGKVNRATVADRCRELRPVDLSAARPREDTPPTDDPRGSGRA